MTEKRALTEVRADEGKPITVTIPFNSLSHDLGGFREQIAPAAFKRALGDTSVEVLAFWNHNPDKPLARRSDGSLSLGADDKALTAQIQPDETTWGQDAAVSVRGGRVKGASFAFQVVADHWARRNGEWVRTLLDADLIEVSPTPAPAYPESTARA